MLFAPNTKTFVQSLNDRGAESFLKEDYSEALRLFREGLGIVRGALHSSMEEAKQQVTHAPHMKHHNGSPRCTEPALPNARKVSPSSSKSYASTGGRFKNETYIVAPAPLGGPPVSSSFTFMYPMLSHSLKHVPDNCFFETACFAFVFNLAICYHKHSISTNTPPPRAAAQLYELAFQTATSNSCNVPVVYLCALMNNAAQVQSMLGNGEGYQKHLITLLGFLPYCVDVHNQRRYSMGCDQRSIELLDEFLPAFYGTVSHLILDGRFTADAA